MGCCGVTEMCYCVDFNPACTGVYCKGAVDSVLKVKEYTVTNLFDSIISNKLHDFDSLMLDTASVKYWYEFFDKSLDKVLAIHVGIFSALVTFAVAMILVKYWFDHSKFEKKIEEIRNKLSTAEQTVKEMELAKNETKRLLNEYNANLVDYNERAMKISEYKVRIFLEYNKIQNGFSLNEFDFFLSLINDCMKNADDASRNNVLLWMMTEKIWIFIGQSLNSKYMEPYKVLFHNLAIDLKMYTEAYSKQYPGSDLSDFAELNTFCSSFGKK